MHRTPTDYTPNSSLLEGRTILITGAGDGIGRASAKAFAAHGATVILLGRTLSKLEQTYDEIEHLNAPQPAILPMDLDRAVEQDFVNLGAMLRAEFGQLDGLLNNAATLGILGPIESYDLETWNKVMRVNLTAGFLLTRESLPLLKSSPDASVVFMSDAVGRQGKAYWGGYCASKFALEGLSQVLAAETHQTTSIRVNSFDPGPVRTSLRARAYPGENPSRLPAPLDVTGSLLYLMGPDSRGISGQMFSAAGQ